MPVTTPPLDLRTPPAAVLFDVFGTLVELSDGSPCSDLIASLQLPGAICRELAEGLLVRRLPTLATIGSYLWEATGVPVPSEVLSRSEDLLARQLAGCTLIDGATELLATLRSHGVRTALVSNLATPYVAALHSLGLRAQVDAAALSCEVGWRKPDPRIFEWALGRLGVPAADAVMIGDDPYSDVEGAKAVGLRTILIDPESRPGRGSVRWLRDLCDPKEGSL